MVNDISTINRIAERAVDTYLRLGLTSDRNSEFARVAIAEEILTVHREVVPLRLVDFLNADELDFIHDIAGIHRHLVMGTRHRRAELASCFLPRFADIHTTTETSP